MRLIPVLATLALSILSLPASANVTYQFSGIVKNGNPVFGAGSPFTVLPSNTTFNATFVYDPTAIGNPAVGNQQSYSFVSSSVTFHPVGGDWTVNSDQTNNVVTVRNDTFADEIQFSANATGATLGGFAPSSLQIVFGGSDLVLGSTLLPGSIDLGDWTAGYTSTYLKVYFNSGFASITGNITSMSLAAVPEPSTYGILAGLAVLGLVIGLRGRRVQP